MRMLKNIGKFVSLLGDESSRSAIRKSLISIYLAKLSMQYGIRERDRSTRRF